jgi:hypothetical protein
MRKYLFLSLIGIAGILCAGFLLYGQATPAVSGPKIEFKEESKDFGRVKQGKILTHNFRFKNVGDATLIVRNVQTSCGCTAALASKKELKPGETGEIKATFNTRGYSGQNTKYVYVESNDPSASRKQLEMKASIDAPPSPKIELDNYSVDLGLVLQGEEMRTEVQIKNKGELELTVTPSHRDAVYFIEGKQVAPPLSVAAKKDVQVQIKIPPRKNKGLIREYVLLRSNDPMRPNLSIYLSGYIVSKAQLKELFEKYKNALE